MAVTRPEFSTFLHPSGKLCIRRSDAERLSEFFSVPTYGNSSVPVTFKFVIDGVEYKFMIVEDVDLNE